jgi:hypothetical protein
MTPSRIAGWLSILLLSAALPAAAQDGPVLAG